MYITVVHLLNGSLMINSVASCYII